MVLAKKVKKVLNYKRDVVIKAKQFLASAAYGLQARIMRRGHGLAGARA